MESEDNGGFMKRALITGITGMDGSHLAELLLEKGYEVYGLERYSSQKNRNNIKNIENRITIIPGDLTDQNSLLRALNKCSPDEVYNLGSLSFVAESWNTPEQVSDVTGLGVLRMLEAIREYKKKVKFYQASSSEMIGEANENIANESTPFYPRSPYGVSKLYGHWITKNYRESYGMFNCCGILFNHESHRRSLQFVTRKITHGVAKIATGKKDHISLGNLDARRDWGYAPEYVEGIYLMMQQKTPDDYILATGKSYSVKDFLRFSFEAIGVYDWEKYVIKDKRFLRPADINFLCGDASKAKEVFGWEPKTSLKEIVELMVNHDIALLRT